ncbi:MAG: hypothetical protein M0D55_13050 [Elusimicrobiota bacterium]|nr:MAG: hypothetical protein M0D55_13050 [Elusimicrobiota bacterium]
MKITALVLAVATFALPVRAQVAVQPAPAAPAEKPSPKCVCDQPGFKPITPGAVAVAEYWQARRKTKISAVVGGFGAIFSLLSQNPNTMREATEGYDAARREMWAAKSRAEAAGALIVRGDDLDGDIEIKLVKGVDYVIEK